MVYRLMASLHLRLAMVVQLGRNAALRRDERGQGTVEYVALILLVAALLAGVVAATRTTRFGTGGIAEAIVNQIKRALTGLR
ncbi:MAG TPA: hypothetical protein VGM91_11040 [Conexibacter sp.]|jgi:Flp pilus assembly pilin Flp